MIASSTHAPTAHIAPAKKSAASQNPGTPIANTHAASNAQFSPKVEQNMETVQGKGVHRMHVAAAKAEHRSEMVDSKTERKATKALHTLDQQSPLNRPASDEPNGVTAVPPLTTHDASPGKHHAHHGGRGPNGRPFQMDPVPVTLPTGSSRELMSGSQGSAEIPVRADGSAFRDHGWSDQREFLGQGRDGDVNLRPIKSEKAAHGSENAKPETVSVTKGNVRASGRMVVPEIPAKVESDAPDRPISDAPAGPPKSLSEIGAAMLEKGGTTPELFNYQRQLRTLQALQRALQTSDGEDDSKATDLQA
jgi:hypothetical protein